MAVKAVEPIHNHYQPQKKERFQPALKFKSEKYNGLQTCMESKNFRVQLSVKVKIFS